MFEVLNVERSKVSPNIILRNRKDENKGVEALYNLSFDPQFVMCRRIAWAQRMNRGELITAAMYGKTVATLHAHIKPARSNHMTVIAGALEKIVAEVGRNTFRDNIRTFFDVLDGAYGIKKIAYRESATYMRGSFLWCLADIFSTYQKVFFSGHKLVVDRTWVKKLALFPLDDPNMCKLASAGGSSRDMLKEYIVRHLNSGKRTKRLGDKMGLDSDSLPAVGSEESESELASA